MKFLITIFLSLAGFFPSFLLGEIQHTLSIIKPDAVKTNEIGAIISRFEKNGLQIDAMKMTNLSQQQAEEFYSVHKEKPFYNDLVSYMTSGPVVIMVLGGEEAVSKNRTVMGATDPKKAAGGTIRADFGTSVQQNAVHGSDSLENAKKEISFFFNKEEIVR